MIKRAYETALEFATNAHKGQVDKAGVDYILHPIAVAALLSDDTEKVVALLHDTVEDCDVTIDELETLFGCDVAAAIKLLTKTDGYVYEDYLSAIKKNNLARKVKIADMTHNSDLSRIKKPTQKDIDRAEKYQKGIAFLKDLSCDICSTKTDEKDLVYERRCYAVLGEYIRSKEKQYMCPKCFKEHLIVYDIIEDAINDYIERVSNTDD